MAEEKPKTEKNEEIKKIEPEHKYEKSEKSSFARKEIAGGKNIVADKKDKGKDNKIILEREYIVPLRKEWLKVPTYKRANKAVKAIKEFIVKHMKVYDRDLRKAKLDIYLNNEIRFRGMRYPPAKIRVKATKYENGEVLVKLVELPKHIEFEIARNARREVESSKKASESERARETDNKDAEKMAREQAKDESASEKKQDAKEKTESSKIATEQLEKQQAKTAKHTAGVKQEPIIQRKALKK